MSTKHLIDIIPDNITPESRLKVTRRGEMITNWRRLSSIVKQILLVSTLGKCTEQYGKYAIQFFHYMKSKFFLKDSSLSYEHQWNAKWAFARKHDIFTMKRSLMLITSLK